MSDSGDRQGETLADRFLQDSRDSRRQVSVYLVSGFQLKGEVVEFDASSILFKNRDVHQLVMRSAVANMYPLPGPKGKADDWWTELVSSSS